jgi:hypothetical protein
MKRKNAHVSMLKTMKVCFVLTTGFEFDDSIFTTIREAEFDVIPPPQDGLPVLANQEHLGARPKQKNRRGRMSRARAYAKWVSQQQAGHLARCEGQGQSEPQPTQQLGATSTSENLEIGTQWQAAASRTIEITNQTIRVQHTIQNQLPLRSLRNFRRPVAIVHPYVPTVGTVTLRQPRTEPLALQANAYTPRPTQHIGLNQLGRGAGIQALFEQRNHEMAMVAMGRGRAQLRAQYWQENVGFNQRAPNTTPLRGPAYLARHSFAANSASASVNPQTAAHHHQVQQTAAVFENMQITDPPHQSTQQQSVDNDDEDDDVVFLGFEL